MAVCVHNGVQLWRTCLIIPLIGGLPSTDGYVVSPTGPAPKSKLKCRSGLRRAWLKSPAETER